MLCLFAHSRRQSSSSVGINVIILARLWDGGIPSLGGVSEILWTSNARSRTLARVGLTPPRRIHSYTSHRKPISNELRAAILTSSPRAGLEPTYAYRGIGPTSPKDGPQSCYWGIISCSSAYSCLGVSSISAFSVVRAHSLSDSRLRGSLSEWVELAQLPGPPMLDVRSW